MKTTSLNHQTSVTTPPFLQSNCCQNTSKVIAIAAIVVAIAASIVLTLTFPVIGLISSPIAAKIAFATAGIAPLIAAPFIGVWFYGKRKHDNAAFDKKVKQADQKFNQFQKEAEKNFKKTCDQMDRDFQRRVTHLHRS